MNKRIIAGLVVGGVAVAGTAVGVGIGLSPQMYEVKIESAQEEARFDGSGKYKIGQQVELVAEAPEGYEFGYWLFNEEKVSEENPYTFKLSKENFGTYTAVFYKQLSITIDQGISHGQVSASVAKTTAGKEVTLTVTPDEHYALSKLYYEVADDENEYDINMQTFKFDMPEKDVTIHAEFVECVYNVSIAQGISNGQITAVPTQGKNGTTIVIQTQAEIGYYLDDLFYVKEGDEENPVTIEENEGVYSFVISSNVTVHAIFLNIEYTIAEFSENVTIKKGETVLTKNDTLHYGDEVEVTYTVPEGYTLVDFGVVGLEAIQGQSNKYTVVGNVSIDYDIEINTYEVSFSQGEGYTLAPVGEIDLEEIEYNTDFKFTLTLDEGYSKSTPVVKVNGQTITATEGIYTINVKEDKTITVEDVELNSYSISEFVSNVIIRRNDVVLTVDDTIYYGDELVITYAPTYGHTKTVFTIEGAEGVEGKENTYKVIDDLTVTYEEEINKYAVTLTEGAGYTLSSEDDLTEIEHGSFISISLTIDDEYNQSTPVVKANGGTISGNGDGTYTIQVLDDLTITVEGVEINKYAVTLTEGTGYYYEPQGEIDLSSIEHGTRIYVKLKLEEAYNQSNPSIMLKGQVLAQGATTFSFVVTEDSVVTVENVEINKYDVTLTQGVGYELQSEDTLTDVAHGSEISFTLTLGEGYSQSTPVVKANGETIYAQDDIYTITVTEATTITVEDIEINKYSVTLTEGEGYTLATVGQIDLDEVEYNTDISFTLTLDEHYDESTPVVKVNNEVIEATNGIYTINVKGNKVVTVEGVEGNVYNVLSFDSEYVTITKDGQPITVSDDLRFGDEIVITYELDEGYDLTTFTVVGANLIEGNTYSVTGDITITFEQQIQAFSLTITNEQNFPIGFKDQDIDLTNIEYGTEVLIYADSIIDEDEIEHYAMIINQDGHELDGEWDSEDEKYYYSLTITENTTISVINYEYVATLSGFSNEYMFQANGACDFVYDKGNPVFFYAEYITDDEDENFGKYMAQIGIAIPTYFDSSNMTLTLGEQEIVPAQIMEDVQVGPDTYANVFIYEFEMNQNGLILSINNVAIQTFDVNIYDEAGETVLYTDEVEYGMASQYKDLTFEKESQDDNYVYQFIGFAELEDESAEPEIIDLSHVLRDLNLRPVFIQRAVLEYELNDDQESYYLKSWYYAGTETEANIVIPEEYEGLPVTGIGAEAFTNSPNVRVTLPSTIQSIQIAAFYGCSQVDVDFTQFDNLLYIGNNAFAKTAVRKVILDNIEQLGGAAFASCQSLTEVSLPNTITRLGTSYSNYTTLGDTGHQSYGKGGGGIQPWIEPTETYTFADCVNLAKVYWAVPGDSISNLGEVFTNSGSASGIEFTIAGNVTAIPNFGDARITELKILADEEERTSIDGLYCYAENIIIDSESVINSMLANQNGYEGLEFKNLYLSTEFDDGETAVISFYGYSAVQASTSDKNGYNLYETEITTLTSGDIYYTILDEDEHTLRIDYVDKSAVRLQIPETIEIDSTTYTVTEVNVSRYYKELLLPKSLSAVALNGFDEIVLYGTGDNLSYQNKILYLDNGEYVIAVAGSSKLSSGIMLRDDVKVIGPNAFAGLNITSVNWSDLTELQIIGQYAFYMTQHLQEVDIPNGVTTILPHAFLGCGARTVRVPESVTSLYIPVEQQGGGIYSYDEEYYTFAGMTNLETLYWDAAYTISGDETTYPEIFAGSGCEKGVDVTFGEHAGDLSIFSGGSETNTSYYYTLHGVPMRIRKLTITADGYRDETIPFNVSPMSNLYYIGLMPNAEVIIDSEMMAEGLLDPEIGAAGMLFNLYNEYLRAELIDEDGYTYYPIDYSAVKIKLYINEEFLDEPIQSEIVGYGQDGLVITFTHNSSSDKEGYELYDCVSFNRNGNGGNGGGAIPMPLP